MDLNPTHVVSAVRKRLGATATATLMMMGLSAIALSAIAAPAAWDVLAAFIFVVQHALPRVRLLEPQVGRSDLQLGSEDSAGMRSMAQAEMRRGELEQR